MEEIENNVLKTLKNENLKGWVREYLRFCIFVLNSKMLIFLLSYIQKTYIKTSNQNLVRPSE